ncbi:MAG: AAA family ATPase [Candidatus Bathyarchaeia archaeon]
MSAKFVIATTGMPGSGKGELSRLFREAGYPVYVCGDVVRREAERRGLPNDSRTLGGLMFKLREEGGRAAIVKRLSADVESDPSRAVVVEGIRNLEEVEELRRRFEVIVVAVHSPPKLRCERLLRRGRGDDPKTPEDFRERDERELRVGVGDVIALADLVIRNEGSLADLEEEFRGLMGRIEGWIGSG